MEFLAKKSVLPLKPPGSRGRLTAHGRRTFTLRRLVLAFVLGGLASCASETESEPEYRDASPRMPERQCAYDPAGLESAQREVQSICTSIHRCLTPEFDVRSLPISHCWQPFCEYRPGCALGVVLELELPECLPTPTSIDVLEDMAFVHDLEWHAGAILTAQGLHSAVTVRTECDGSFCRSIDISIPDPNQHFTYASAGLLSVLVFPVEQSFVYLLRGDEGREDALFVAGDLPFLEELGFAYLRDVITARTTGCEQIGG